MSQTTMAGLDVMPYWVKIKALVDSSQVKPFNILMFVGLLSMIWYRKWVNVQHAKKLQKMRSQSASKFPEIEPLEDFEWEKTEPLQFRPFKPKYHLTMALENLDPSELIPMDNTYKERIDIRRQLLKDHYDVVLGVNKNKLGEEDPRVRAAVGELYQFVLGNYLPTRYPKMFKLLEANFESGKTMLVQNQITREMLPTTLSPGRPTIMALETLAKTVDEEMLILLPEIKESNSENKNQKYGQGRGEKEGSDPPSPDDENKYVLEAYATCFPSGFDTRTKLGRKLSEIHDPVPGYKQKLEKSMDRFFDKLEVGKFVKRLNWTMTTDADLFSAFGGIHAGDGEDMTPLKVEDLDLNNTFLRCERQSLYRLPTSGALVFSFHTYRYPIQQIKEEGSGEDLAAAIDGFEAGSTPLIGRYKRVPAWGEAVKAYLRS
ncbi:hypothetical protein CPC735_006190 [Coccidioides posadasii C735 delta SOWgp]|nr:hypothetical protein CPC735_006190 [Coccidioides posadasii C735 delta SOWgp]EER26447.1 hypothetical protein CPC735_006190 [Coccidioides posadasii C735 delta SOWgp]|eukprot:XP_003068592.1 hypothetical protein CPC735_006190 [Coccidioides posadasii C735 delta SOWgp]